MREALFDIAGTRLRGGRFLDLFSGSGAVGLEAFSRGASQVVLVDSREVVTRTLRSTCDRLDLQSVETIRLDLPRQLGRLTAAGGFDWIFADPPYAFEQYPDLIAGLPELLSTGGVAVVEHDARVELPIAVGEAQRYDQRRYGECALSFYAASPVD